MFLITVIIKLIFKNQYKQRIVIMQIKKWFFLLSNISNYYLLSCKHLLGMFPYSNKTSALQAELVLIFKDNWKHTEKPSKPDLILLYLKNFNVLKLEVSIQLRSIFTGSLRSDYKSGKETRTLSNLFSASCRGTWLFSTKLDIIWDVYSLNYLLFWQSFSVSL